MGQLTLVQAGAVVTASSRKARKAVKTAMRLYEELYGLYEGAALTIPDVGIAFLRGKNFTKGANNSSGHFIFSSSIGLYTLAQSGSIHYCSIRLNLLQYSY